MVSLFDVDIYSNLDPGILDADSRAVYNDPQFAVLANVTDDSIIYTMGRITKNNHELILDRLPVMLYLLDTPESNRVLMRSDFDSLSILLPTLWEPASGHLKALRSDRHFRKLLKSSDDQLAADISELNVDPSRIRKFPAILLLTNTVSSWVLLGSTDTGSIVAASESSNATERRIRSLRDELYRLERNDVVELISSGERSIAHLPVEIVRQIVLNTHDIARLSELQKISSVYAEVLDDPVVLQQLADWWMSNEDLKMRAIGFGGTPTWPLSYEPQTFKEFRRWVVNNYYTSLCAFEAIRGANDCFLKMIERNDMETWHDIKKTMTSKKIMDILNEVSLWTLINNDSHEIAQYVLDNNVGTSYGSSEMAALTITFGTADDLLWLLNDIKALSEYRESYFSDMAADLWRYILIRRDYDRDITRILLDMLAKADTRNKSLLTANYGPRGFVSEGWIADLITDLKSGYYSYHNDLPSILDQELGEPTNYWLEYYDYYTDNSRAITLADYLRDILLHPEDRVNNNTSVYNSDHVLV